MLALSESASETITTLVQESPRVDTDAGGLRLFLADANGGEAQLEAAITAGLEIDDEVVERGGACVFVDPALTYDVAGKTLAISEDENGRAAVQLLEPRRVAGKGLNRSESNEAVWLEPCLRFLRGVERSIWQPRTASDRKLGLILRDARVVPAASA